MTERLSYQYLPQEGVTPHPDVAEAIKSATLGEIARANVHLSGDKHFINQYMDAASEGVIAGRVIPKP